ncbi:MAG: TIGR00159 family protein [Bacteroidaceae bacterium]|nr:TIGR00159 family protein [Bacteroidaceae bacterium]
MFSFLDFSIVNVIDIFAVACILYYAYHLLQRSRSVYVFVGVLIFIYIMLLVNQVYDMPMLSSIMKSLTNVGIFCLVVIFQADIRKFFYRLGSNKRVMKLVHLFQPDVPQSKRNATDLYMPIVMACMNMSRTKVGALIVIEREQKLDDLIHDGDIIDAKVNQRLIENIFFKNSPLHDGAMIISEGRIHSAGCILPVSHSYDIPKDLGLRHRSAMGIAQETDALAIVVSEETGRIAVALGGSFHLRLTAEQLEQFIRKQ